MILVILLKIFLSFPSPTPLGHCLFSSLLVWLPVWYRSMPVPEKKEACSDLTSSNTHPSILPWSQDQDGTEGSKQCQVSFICILYEVCPAIVYPPNKGIFTRVFLLDRWYRLYHFFWCSSSTPQPQTPSSCSLFFRVTDTLCYSVVIYNIKNVKVLIIKIHLKMKILRLYRL